MLARVPGAAGYVRDTQGRGTRYSHPEVSCGPPKCLARAAVTTAVLIDPDPEAILGRRAVRQMDLRTTGEGIAILQPLVMVGVAHAPPHGRSVTTRQRARLRWTCSAHLGVVTPHARQTMVPSTLT